MIKANTINLYLSQSTVDLIKPVPTLATAIYRHLKEIIPQLKPDELLPNNPRQLEKSAAIILDANIYQRLIIATQTNPSLTISAAVDVLLYQHLSDPVPTISEDSLIVGTDQITLEFGVLVQKTMPVDRKYWYWRYYNIEGNRRDKYMGKALDKALAKVRHIGCPDDAAPQRKNKGKKTYSTNVVNCI